MSYFIANAISFSKDRKTFKVKGGDNNVVPRGSNWTNDIAIEHLFNELSSWNIQLTDGNQNHQIIDSVMRKHKESFWGSWEDETDLYHCYYLRNRTLEQVYEDLEIVKWYNYKKEIMDKYISHYQWYIDNYDDIRNKLIQIENDFLTEMFYSLDNKDDWDYVVTNWASYIFAWNLRSRKVSTCRTIEAAKIFTKEIAEAMAKSYTWYYIEKVNK